MKLQEENFKEGKESNIFLSLEIATAKLLRGTIKQYSDRMAICIHKYFCGEKHAIFSWNILR